MSNVKDEDTSSDDEKPLTALQAKNEEESDESDDEPLVKAPKKKVSCVQSLVLTSRNISLYQPAAKRKATKPAAKRKAASPKASPSKRRKTATESKTPAKQTKRVAKVYDLPGQKRDTPPEVSAHTICDMLHLAAPTLTQLDELRMFYESLYKQKPDSEMVRVGCASSTNVYEP